MNDNLRVSDPDATCYCTNPYDWHDNLHRVSRFWEQLFVSDEAQIPFDGLRYEREMDNLMEFVNNLSSSKLKKQFWKEFKTKYSSVPWVALLPHAFWYPVHSVWLSIARNFEIFQMQILEMILSELMLFIFTMHDMYQLSIKQMETKCIKFQQLLALFSLILTCVSSESNYRIKHWQGLYELLITYMQQTLFVSVPMISFRLFLITQVLEQFLTCSAVRTILTTELSVDPDTKDHDYPHMKAWMNIFYTLFHMISELAVIKHAHLLQTNHPDTSSNPTPFSSIASILILPIPGKPMEYLQQQYTKQLHQQENQSYLSRFKASSRSSSTMNTHSIGSGKDAVIFWNETVLDQYIQSMAAALPSEEKEGPEMDTITSNASFHIAASLSSSRRTEHSTDNTILQGNWSKEEREAYIQIVKKFLGFNDWIQSCGIYFPQVIVLWLQSFLSSTTTLSQRIHHMSKTEKKQKKQQKRILDDTSECGLGDSEEGTINTTVLTVNEIVGVIISKCYIAFLTDETCFSKMIATITTKVKSTLQVLQISADVFLDEITKVNAYGINKVQNKQKSSLLEEYSVHFPSYANHNTVWSTMQSYFMQPKIQSMASESRQAKRQIEDIMKTLKQEEFHWQLLTTSYMLTTTSSSSRKISTTSTAATDDQHRPNISFLTDTLLQKGLTILLNQLPHTEEIEDTDYQSNGSSTEISQWLEFVLSMELFTFYTSHASSTIFLQGDDYLLYVMSHCCESVVSVLEYLASHNLLLAQTSTTNTRKSHSFHRYFNTFIESTFYLLLHRMYLLLPAQPPSTMTRTDAKHVRIQELLVQLFDFHSEYTNYLVRYCLPYAYTLYFGVYVLPLLRPPQALLIQHTDDEVTIEEDTTSLLHRNSFAKLLHTLESIVFAQQGTSFSMVHTSIIFPCYWYILPQVSVGDASRIRTTTSKKKSLSMILDVFLSEWSNNNSHYDVHALPNLHSNSFTHSFGMTLHQERLLPSLRAQWKLQERNPSSSTPTKHLLLCLPSELLIHIFSFCSYKRMCRLSCVHSHFAKLISLSVSHTTNTNANTNTPLIITSEYFPYHERLWRELYYRAFSSKVKCLDDLLTTEQQQAVADPEENGIRYCQHCFPTTSFTESLVNETSVKYRYVTACCAQSKEMHHWQRLMKEKLMKLKQYKRANHKHSICPILGCTQRIMNYKGDEEAVHIEIHRKQYEAVIIAMVKAASKAVTMKRKRKQQEK